MYEYINLEAKKLKAINSLMNDEVDNYSECLDELEDLGTAKNLILDILISMRENANLLNIATDDLNKINKDLIRDGSIRKSDRNLSYSEQIEIKAKRLNHRY